MEEPVPVEDEPLPRPPGEVVVLEPEPMEPEPVEEPEPVVLGDVPPDALEVPWFCRQRSFSTPVMEAHCELVLDPAAELPLPRLPLDPPTPLPPLLELPVLLPPTLLPEVPPRLPPVPEPPLEPLVPPALAPALPPAPPPDCAIAVIAKSAAAVAVTKSFSFI